MEITVEISYYPLTDDYRIAVDEFIKEISSNKKISVEKGTMSSLITGQFDDVMVMITQKLKLFMNRYNSVFSLKISNSCKTF
jgi:uncharacterized protein YqgV (UPF0045/DUF77 family)